MRTRLQVDVSYRGAGDDHNAAIAIRKVLERLNLPFKKLRQEGSGFAFCSGVRDIGYRTLVYHGKPLSSRKYGKRKVKVGGHEYVVNLEIYEGRD